MDNLPTSRGFMPGLFGKLDEEKMPLLTRVMKHIPAATKNHFVAGAGEFVGTFMFLFFPFAAAQIANTSKTVQGFDVSRTAPQNPDLEQLMYISVAFGFSLAVNAWVFYRISGGLFNPAVSLALFLVGAIEPIRAVVTVAAQVLGATSAAAVVSALYPGSLQVTTRLGGETSITQGLFIEMFLTAGLVFTILMLAVEKTKATFLAPVGIGLSLFITQLAGVYFTGASLNPARSIGPDIAIASFPGYHWIYWVGPGLGSILAVVFYEFLKGIRYETANPGQDFDGQTAFDPETDCEQSRSRSRDVSSMSTERGGDLERGDNLKPEPDTMV